MTLFIYLFIIIFFIILFIILSNSSFIYFFYYLVTFFRKYLSLFIYFNSIIPFKCFIFIFICIYIFICVFYFTTIIIIIMTYPMILFMYFFICLRVLKKIKIKTPKEVVVCGLEKHCGDSAITSPPIIATVECRRCQRPRQCTMSRSGPRFSGMRKQVLGLYKVFLWAARPKSPEDRRRIESFVFS